MIDKQTDLSCEIKLEPSNTTWLAKFWGMFPYWNNAGTQVDDLTRVTKITVENCRNNWEKDDFLTTLETSNIDCVPRIFP